MKLVLTFLLTIASTQSIAANIWCTGKISNLYINSSNQVIIKGDWRGRYTKICNTTGADGIDVVTCSLWTSLATTSMTTDKSVTLMYNDQGGAFNCSDIPIYASAPTPSYVMLVK